MISLETLRLCFYGCVGAAVLFFAAGLFVLFALAIPSARKAKKAEPVTTVPAAVPGGASNITTPLQRPEQTAGSGTTTPLRRPEPTAESGTTKSLKRPEKTAAPVQQPDQTAQSGTTKDLKRNKSKVSDITAPLPPLDLDSESGNTEALARPDKIRKFEIVKKMIYTDAQESID